MSHRQAKRVVRELTPAEKERLEKCRDQISRELPDLESRDQMRKDAREESTLRSDVIDRVAGVLGCELNRAR